MPTTVDFHTLPLNDLLERAAVLIAREPQPDVAHIINAIAQTCYQHPAFLELPPFQQELVLEWLGDRIALAAWRIRQERRIARLARLGDPWCTPQGQTMYFGVGSNDEGHEVANAADDDEEVGCEVLFEEDDAGEDEMADLPELVDDITCGYPPVTYGFAKLADGPVTRKYLSCRYGLPVGHTRADPGPIFEIWLPAGTDTGTSADVLVTVSIWDPYPCGSGCGSLMSYP
ncbi:hypothetical protein C8Q76DRAFT_691221 [Earliella scabrosa]|nr:hypothetical protein C8Q76DRAFT_691221 [Earliella scabrosa]